MSTKYLSVQKHRAKMAADECGRFEITLGAGLIAHARARAKQIRVPVWQVVEWALVDYLELGNQTGSATASNSYASD